VDEVLAVGDAAFQEKCVNRIHEMLKNATTLLLVSHVNSMVERLCEKAIWLKEGEIVMSGSAQEVCAAYAEYYK
jgi:ABC-type polysaccharide/polyol phosphate transport system ATPase subunit